MEWLKKIIGNDNYDKVVELLGDTKILPSDGSYIPKSKFDELNTENKILRDKVTSFEANAKEVEKIVSSNNELKEQFKQLKDKHTSDIALKDKEIGNITKRSALKDFLNDSGAIHSDLLMTQIDIDSLELKDGKVNLDITGLKEKYSNLFTTKQVNSTPLGSGGNIPNFASQKDTLIKRYNEAESKNDTMQMLSLHKQIRELKEN